MKKGMVMLLRWKVTIHSRWPLTILASTGIKREWSWWCKDSSTLPVVTKVNKTSPRDAWKNSIENWSVLLYTETQLKTDQCLRTQLKTNQCCYIPGIPGTYTELSLKENNHFNQAEKGKKRSNVKIFLVYTVVNSSLNIE